MTDGVPIHRIEHADTTRVVYSHQMRLLDPRKRTPLEEEYPAFFTTAAGPDTVRIGMALNPDTDDGYQIHGVNGVYAEVPLIERELTAAERDWCEETFMYRGSNQPDTVYEFAIPHPEALRDVLLTNDVEMMDCLDAIITDAETRGDVLRTFQTRIETAKFRTNRLDWYSGSGLDLDPEWDPDSDYTDHDRRALCAMSRMEMSSYTSAFKEIAGYPYHAYFTARERVLGVTSPHHDDFDRRIAFDVIGRDDWDHCQLCIGAYPKADFLHITGKGTQSRVYRACVNCAERKEGRYFTEEAVNKAKDEYVQKHGGQRLLDGYADEATDEES
jgi:hypothetical protein